MADEVGLMPEKRGPGRPPRAEVERAARRRRKGAVTESIMSVPDEIKRKLAAEGKEGRWINDVDNRMHAKTVNDDWDKVPGVAPIQVGVDKRTGQPITAHYCAKLSSFLEEDRNERLNTLTERERAIVRGQDADTAVDGSYQPHGAPNRIGNIT